jgi:Aspartyl protease
LYLLMQKILHTGLFLLLLLPFAFSQTDTIPFTLNRQSNICVKARINYSDTLTLMFHSASTGITLTRTTVDTKLALSATQSDTVQTWGGSAESQYSEGNTLKIGKLTWDNQTIYINENSGANTDGKFGHDFFSDKILEFDYDNKWLLAHAKLPQKARKYHKMNLYVSDGALFMEGGLTIGSTLYRDTFMIHTGYGGAILLDPSIGDQYNMKAQLATISSSELRDAYNNVFKIETKQLPELRIGNKRLKNVPLSFAARSSEIPMKVFGNDLLKRFNVIFDFEKRHIYLKMNGLADVAYAVKKS